MPDELTPDALPEPVSRNIDFGPKRPMTCPECRGPMELAQVAMGRYTVWRCWHCTVAPDRPAHWSGTLVLRANLAGPNTGQSRILGGER